MLVTYKGRQYKQLFVGPTKFGRRAKLAFLDGGTEFWVDAKLVSPVSAGKSHAPRAARSGKSLKTCRVCGGNEVNQTECGACA